MSSMSSMKKSKKPMSSMSSMKESKKPMSSKTQQMTKTVTATSPSTGTGGIDVAELTEKATKELKGEGVGVFVDFDTKEIVANIENLVATIPKTANGATFKDIVLVKTTKKGATTTTVRISVILTEKAHLDIFINSMKATNATKFLNPQGVIAVSAKGLSVAVAFLQININDPNANQKAKDLMCVSPVCVVELRTVQTTFLFRQATKTEGTATQKADSQAVKSALTKKGIDAKVRVAKVVSNDTFSKAVKQSVDKEIKQLKASQTRTVSMMSESTEIPSVTIKEQKSSMSVKPTKTWCSKHSKSMCTKHHSKDSTKKHSMSVKPSKASKHSMSVKPSKTWCSKHSKYHHSTKKHSMGIKPSKTRTMMPVTHTVTRPTVETNEIICGKEVGVMKVNPGESKNFTNVGFPKYYSSFDDCILRISARQGTKNSIRCDEVVLGHGSKLCIYDGDKVVKKYRCHDRNMCRICPEEFNVGDKVKIHVQSCMFQGKIQCRFESLKSLG